MRGRLSTVDLFNVRPLVPGLYRPKVVPSIQHPAAKVIEGSTPLPNPIKRRMISMTEKWMPRRWPTTLGDNLELIQPRAQPTISLTPLQAPNVASSAPSGGGFWSNIASGLSSAVAGVLPAFAQIKTAQLMTSQQAALLKQQGAQLYTPGNIQTLQQQAEFEAAQRLVNQGRMTGATEMPISTTLIIGGLVVGGLIWAVTRKK